MNPSILHYARGGNSGKALLFLAFAVVAFLVAGLMYDDAHAPPPPPVPLAGGLWPASAPRRDPLAPFHMIVLIGAGCGCLFYAARHGGRAATARVAARIENGRLYSDLLHDAGIGSVDAHDITQLLVDRADRLPGDLSVSVGLGARFRHGLYFAYRTDQGQGVLRLIDNDVDGGTEQLRRFSAYLEAWRKPAADRIRQA